MRSLVMRKVGGRRDGDLEGPKWEFSLFRTFLTALITAIAGSLLVWGTWVTKDCSLAEKNKETLDLQIGVLHNRITDLGNRSDAEGRRILDKIEDNRDAQHEATQKMLMLIIDMKQEQSKSP